MLVLERSARGTLRGVRACVVGRSTVVGLPVALLLIARDATVTVVHRGTRDLARETRAAEVLVVAAGVPGTMTADMVAPGATVIDVGTTYVDGKVAGDVAFDEVADVAGEITPVPGGVGPVTDVALLRNVVSPRSACARRARASVQREVLAEELLLVLAELAARRVAAHDGFLLLLALDQRAQLRQQPAQEAELGREARFRACAARAAAA